MSRDKQIEEMQRFIDLNVFTYKDEEKVYGTKGAAEVLYNKGYRKADEVAREIFEEIEEVLNMQAKIVCQTRDNYRETDKPMLSFIAMLDGRIYSLRIIEEHIAELKKKYTEGEE